jgi:hypothetical protein
MMVQRYDDEHLILVLQIDHSRIAGLIAAHWGNSEFATPTPYESMVLAAQEHDGGWWDWEIKPTLNRDGYPLDYIDSIATLGSPYWLKFYAHGIQRVADEDPYAGWVMSMHGDGLLTQGMGLLPYMPDWTVEPAVREWIGEQKAFRERLLAHLRENDDDRDVLTEEHLWTNFKLMEVFDQIGQFVCNRYPFNSTSRRNGPSKTMSNAPVPVAPGRDDVTLTIDVLDESRAVVRPYPFDIDPFVISYQGRLAPNRPYSDVETFRRDFYKADRVNVTYTLTAA